MEAASEAATTAQILSIPKIPVSMLFCDSFQKGPMRLGEWESSLLPCGCTMCKARPSIVLTPVEPLCYGRLIG